MKLASIFSLISIVFSDNPTKPVATGEPLQFWGPGRIWIDLLQPNRNLWDHKNEASEGEKGLDVKVILLENNAQHQDTRNTRNLARTLFASRIYHPFPSTTFMSLKTCSCITALSHALTVMKFCRQLRSEDFQADLIYFSTLGCAEMYVLQCAKVYLQTSNRNNRRKRMV